MIVGLVSTWNEGRLAADAVRSLLACCDVVLVQDGPIGEAAGGIPTDWTAFRRDPRVIVASQGAPYVSDADKRTWLLERTLRYPGPVWGVILDGDELLVHGGQVPALLEHHEAQAALQEREPLRVPLRLVDGDGTTSVVTGRILRVDLAERYVHSSYEIRLRNGVTVALGNGRLVGGDEPDTTRLDVTTGLQLRRPLQGEPHILHRPYLRAPQRDAVRQSAAEGAGFETLVREAGLGSLPDAQDGRTSIWLPQ